MITNTKAKRHPFSFTLGEGPYTWVGSFDLGAVLACAENGNMGGYENGMREFGQMKLKAGGGSCAHCNHAILNIQLVRNGKGEIYGVGSDCIAKVADEGDVSRVSDMERKIRADASAKRRAREQAKIDALVPAYNEALKVLAAKPHPNSYFASKGKTAADYYHYVSRNPANMKAAIAAAH